MEEGQNHWRHLIGINVTGGLRQIIEKNGRLSLTRVTQAPPADTPPEEFGDMIGRDFKATITYIRRLGYQVGEPLDLVVLTSAENKAVLEDMTWDGARFGQCLHALRSRRSARAWLARPPGSVS